MADDDEGMVVLELFTSPLCYDSPPAHDAFNSIAADEHENVITLMCHGTYFNKGKRTDPLSAKFCTERHKDYYIGLKLRGIKVPHTIINGQFDTAGDVESTVRAGSRMGRSLKNVERIPLKLNEHKLEITLPEMDLPEPVDVWIFGYDREHSGSLYFQSDLDVEYKSTNVVRHLQELPEWDGLPKNVSYSIWDMPADGYAVIVQYSDQTNIIAAGKAERNYSKPKQATPPNPDQQ